MNEESLFESALRLSPEDRSNLLDRECANQPELRRRLEKLLAAFDRQIEKHETQSLPDPGRIHTLNADDQTASTDNRNSGVGTLLAGKYKLIESIGEGGMGRVYMAQQTEPVKRAVAVKIIKAGMDSKQVLARFEAERQALAMMDHPNIAKVLDAGTTESGRPFFVMELVKGTPITQFCDERKLTPRQRLELFVPVCQAIQHAHQKGIIHRDIKPSNVLIAMYDDRPVPKVIDFGVAKAAGPSLTDNTLMTGFGAVVGTPEYMSPEQANLNNLDIDTRSDVYSLGVLLYELLTGSTPVDRKSLGKAALLEVLRIVREVEAPRPSAKLSTIDTLPSVAANRGTEPAKLSKLMKGELDWVLLKALEKDRTRRYETANGLARDIQRYLSDELVEARPASAGYRMKKFVRRHKGQVIAASLVLVAILAGAGVAVWQAMVARAAERNAVAAGLREAEQRTRADEEAAIAAAVNDFLQKDLLNQANADEFSERKGEFDPDLKVRTALDLAAATVGHTFRDRPIVEAAIRQTLGNAYRSLGEYARSIEHLERAYHQRRDRLGPDHSSTLSAMLDLVTSYRANRIDDAITLARTAWDIQQARHGKAHPDALKALKQLQISHLQQNDSKIAEAIPFFEQVAAEVSATHGPDNDATLTVQALIPWLHGRAGNYRQGEELLEQIHRTRARINGPEAPETLTSLLELARAYCGGDRREEGLKLFRQIHATYVRIHGPEDDRTLGVLNWLGSYLGLFGQPDEAVTIYQTILDVRRRTIGLPHPKSWSSQHQLGMSLTLADRAGEAVTVFERLRDFKAKHYGEGHPNVMDANVQVAYALRIAGRPDEAIRLLEPIYANVTRKPDAADTTLDHVQLGLANSYADAGHHAKAIAQIEEMLARLQARKTPSNNDVRRIEVLLLLRINHFRIMKDPLACRATAEMWEKYLSAKTTYQLVNVACFWAITAAVQAKAPGADAAKLAQDDADKAMAWLHKAVQAGHWDANEFKDDPDLDALRERDDYKKLIADLEAKAGKRLITLPFLEANLKHKKSLHGPGHPNTLVCMYNLARGYQSFGKLDMALPLYEETLPLMRTKLGTDHSHTILCMADLAAAYWSLKRLDQSVPFFEELLPLEEKKYGRDHPYTLMAVANLGVNYKDAGRLKEAIPLLEEGYRASRTHASLRFVGTHLLNAYAKAGETNKQANLVKELLQSARKTLPPDSPQLASELAQIGLGLLEQKMWTEAEPLLRECLAIREKTQPNVWTTFNTQSLLGGALLGQKKYAEAEPLLLKGYEETKQREKSIPPQGNTRIPEAIDRLIELYTATNKPDEVKKWQAERAKYASRSSEPAEKK